MYRRPTSFLKCTLSLIFIYVVSGTDLIANDSSSAWGIFVNGYPGTSDASEPAVGYDGNVSGIARTTASALRMPEESSALLLSTDAGSEQPNSTIAEPSSTIEDVIFSETDSTASTTWWSDASSFSSTTEIFSTAEDDWIPNAWSYLSNRENEDFQRFSDRDAHSTLADTMASDDDNEDSTATSGSTIDWVDVASPRSSVAGMANGRSGPPTASGNIGGGGGPSVACTELVSAVFRDACVDAFDPLRVKVSANRYLSTAYQTLTGPSAARLLGATTAVPTAAGGGSRLANLSTADALTCSLARHWTGSRYADCASGSQGVLTALARLRPDCLPGDGTAQLGALFDGLDRMASVLNNVCTGLLPSEDTTACDLVAEATCQSEAATVSNMSSQLYGIGLVCDGALRLQTFSDCLRQRAMFNCTAKQATIAKTLENVAGAYNLSTGVTLADMAASCMALKNQCDSGKIDSYSQQCLAGVSEYLFAPSFTVTLGSRTSVNWKVVTSNICQNLSLSLSCLNARVPSGAMACQPLVDIAQKATATYRAICNELLQDDTTAMKNAISSLNVSNVSYGTTTKKDALAQTPIMTATMLSDAKAVTSAPKFLTTGVTSSVATAVPSPTIVPEAFFSGQILTTIIASSLSTSVQPEPSQVLTTTTIGIDAPSSSELQGDAAAASTVAATARPASSTLAPTQGPWGPADKLGRGSVLKASAPALMISLSFSGGFMAIEVMSIFVKR